MVMSGRSVNLPTLFLGRLRPPKRLTSTLCTYFRQKLTTALLGLNIFYFLNKYDNISIHCNLQITGSERKQEYLYSASPEHIKFVKFTGRILNFQYKVY